MVAGLVRYWIDFEVEDLEPVRAPGSIVIDGGNAAYRFCARGIGVTGHDIEDCLAMVEAVLAPDLMPPIRAVTAGVDVQSLRLPDGEVGTSVWRGIWFPGVNRSGPKMPDL